MASRSALKWQALVFAGSVALALVLAFSGVIDPVIDSRSIFIFISVFFGSVVVGAAGATSAITAAF